MNDFSEIYCWFLWKRRVDDTSVRFLHHSDLPQLGFISVYAVDKQTARALEATKDSRGFKGIVYSDRLWIDCDTEESAETVERGLKELGLGFEKWHTGNRGSHFGVKREAEPSQLLPLQDKAWVKARFPSADLKLYSHLHLFRLPGHTHDKTGRKKVLLYSVDGKAIVFDGSEAPKEAPQSIAPAASNDMGSVFDDARIMEWSTPQTGGKRHETLMKLALRFAERRESREFAARWMEHVNMLYTEPKSDEEIQKLLTWAYEVKA